MAMLALTAFHDVMKVEALLPKVAAEHAPYLGFKEGDVINDHDIALGYLLDHYSHLLPSFTGLTPENRKSVRFTQSKMSFNHGWLVQAEAPPGAIFSSFKELLTAGRATAQDISFYFVHWLTDLAGAVPTPLPGAAAQHYALPGAPAATPLPAAATAAAAAGAPPAAGAAASQAAAAGPAGAASPPGLRCRRS